MTMSLHLRQLRAIAYATLLEGMQQPAALLLLLACVVLTALTPVFQFHTMGEEGRLARDGGLAFMLLFGLVLAATAASGSLSAELDRGTAAAVLSKPVPRALFLGSKFIGVLGLVALLWSAALPTTLLAERAAEHFVMDGDELGSHADTLTSWLVLLTPGIALALAAALNRFGRVRFGLAAFLGIPLAQLILLACCGCYTRFGHWTWYHPDLNGRVPAAALLILLALVMFVALATALATRLHSGATLAGCAAVLLAGLVGDLWLGQAAALSWRGLAGGLIPNLQQFWMCDALGDGGSISWHYVAAAAGYAATWCALVLGLGILALRRRDLG